MTSDDIMRMAREAGLSKVVRAHPDGTMTIEMPHPDKLERFAALVASAEREACAKLCEETTAAWTQHLYNSGCMDCAAAIRARGSHGQA